MSPGPEPAPGTPEISGVAPVRPGQSGRATRHRIALVTLVVLVTVGGWRYRVTRPAYRFEAGLRAVADHDWKAVGEAADRLSASGHTDRSHVLRAEMLYSRKDPDAALAECNQVGTSDAPVHLRAATLSGKCLLELGEPAEARRVFTFVVGQQPDNADARRGLAAAAYDLGNMSEALAHLEEVARLDPADYRPHRLMGNIHRDAGHWDRAEPEYREALRLGADGTAAGDEVRADLAETLVFLAKFSEALSVLDGARGGGPEPPAVAATRGQALRGLGRGPEAAALVDRVLGQHPDGALFRLGGQLALDRGDAAAAIPMFEEATRRQRAPYQVYLLLGQAYRLAGRPDDAARAVARGEEIRRDVEAAADLSREASEKPLDPAVRLRLAAVFDRLGDAQLAAMWRRAAGSLASRR